MIAPIKKSVTVPGKKQMRFELAKKHHDAARVLRAQTELSNEDLWIDMMKVYMAHPKEWITAKKA
jgi:hypothetical protein